MRPAYIFAAVLIIVIPPVVSIAISAGEAVFADEPGAYALYDRMLDMFRSEKTIDLESKYDWGDSRYANSDDSLDFRVQHLSRV
ncbi:MAG: hypothetical protein JW814_01590 [Candidatus Krumholzibacteriota bacterium]|nr:hypothetical protein [Candidatus Krumholzibacteriota bacterium]